MSRHCEYGPQGDGIQGLPSGFVGGVIGASEMERLQFRK